MQNSLQKKIVGVITMACLVIGVVLFRAPISRLFSFERVPSEPPSVVEEPVIPEVPPSDNTPPNMPPPAAKKPPETFAAIFKKVLETREVPSDYYSRIPSYTGRPLSEIRPVPEEVKLFTEEQKQQLYGTIRTHAKAVEQTPFYFNGLIQVGILKKTIGDFEGARDAWEYANLVEPLNSLSYSNLGELYWRYLHEYPKSEANFRIAIRHKPDDWQNYISLAELYHYSFKEKAESADDVLLEGLKALPNDGTIMRRLAYLYEQRGEYKDAILWWEKILATNPDDAEVKEKIEKLKTKL